MSISSTCSKFSQYYHNIKAKFSQYYHNIKAIIKDQQRQERIISEIQVQKLSLLLKVHRSDQLFAINLILE